MQYLYHTQFWLRFAALLLGSIASVQAVVLEHAATFLMREISVFRVSEYL